MMRQFFNKNKIFSFCVAISFLLHVAPILLLEKYSHWVSPCLSPNKGDSSFLAIEKNTIAIDLFSKEQNVKTKKEINPPEKPLKIEMPLPSFPLEAFPRKASSCLASSLLSMDSKDLQGKYITQTHTASFSFPSEIELHTFEAESIELPKELVPDFFAPPSNGKTPLVSLVNKVHPHWNPISCKQSSGDPIHFNFESFSDSLFNEEKEPFGEQIKPFLFPKLPNFSISEDISSVSYSDSVDTEVVFFPLENEQGYVFAVTLIVQPDIVIPKIHHHYSFLIDCSNSMQKEYLAAIKSAVAAAIEQLDLEDSFNIIAFDGKIEKLASSPILAIPSSIEKGKAFLQSIELGSFFSTTNLLRPLLLTVPATREENKFHTAILFSNGEALSKKSTQLELALDWTNYNNGKVSLYAIGTGNGSQLATLDVITSLNQGKVLHSFSKRGIKRKLLKLIKNIAHPVATQLSIETIQRLPRTSIALYPEGKQAASIYLEEPYVILGRINQLDDFVLFIQGQMNHQWVNIKKNISFIHAKQGGSVLKTQWGLLQAYELYKKYLADFNPQHLTEAKAILDAHELQVAFQ